MMKTNNLFKNYIKYTSLNFFIKELLCAKWGIMKKYNTCQHLYLFAWLVLIVVSLLYQHFVFVILALYRLFEISTGTVYKILYPKKDIIYKRRALLLAVYTYIEYILLFAVLYLNIDYSFQIYDQLTNIVNALYFSATTITTLGFGDIVPKNIYSKIATIFESITGILYIAVFLYYTASIYFERKRSELKR